MSLRLFHIVFIVAAALLCAFAAFWGGRGFVESGSIGWLAFGVLFLALGLMLAEYGRRTFKKLKEMK